MGVSLSLSGNSIRSVPCPLYRCPCSCVLACTSMELRPCVAFGLVREQWLAHFVQPNCWCHRNWWVSLIPATASEVFHGGPYIDTYGAMSLLEHPWSHVLADEDSSCHLGWLGNNTLFIYPAKSRWHRNWWAFLSPAIASQVCHGP